MKRKYKVILTTYTLAALTALGVYSFAAHRLLSDYELAARYSSARAFEETVQSVEGLKNALEKSLYATDSAMLSKLCSDAYAGALAAETAMSTLPFSNYQLEQLNTFLNFAGDYAYTLGRQGLEKAEGKEAEILRQLSERAGEFSHKLRELQSSVNSGELIMDSVQKGMGNLRGEEALVSRAMLDYEGGLEAVELPEYDGKYNAQNDLAEGELTVDEMKALAAAFAGVEVQQLKEEYNYSGTEGRKCYSAGGTLICVSPAGVESLGQTRLVSEVKLSAQQARKAAEEYLKNRGFENLAFSESKNQGAVSVMKFAATEKGVPWLDNYIKVAIAMDDGSVYSFDAKQYSREESGVSWGLAAEKIAQNIPDLLGQKGIEKLVINSPGGEPVACYKISCTDEKGRNVELFVDGNSGKQLEINIGIE